MGEKPILADSSFYIQLLREGLDPLKHLIARANGRDLVICGVVRCEVARGLRYPQVRQKFSAVWNVMRNVPTDNRLWDEAENLLWALDREGTVIPLTDAVIACCAKRAGAAVLTYDKHFNSIPNLEVCREI